MKVSAIHESRTIEPQRSDATVHRKALGPTSTEYDNTPRQLMQRARINSVFGDVAQCKFGENEIHQGKLAPVQRIEDEDEESPAQLKSSPLQRMEDEELEEDLPIHAKFAGLTGPVQRETGDSAASRENRTGMPDQLKANLEAMSAFDLSDVRVHRNSDKPAQLSALAYAQGNEIHLGPGQEQHLPHEAWHVVQQRQGRVRTVTQLRGVAINDDIGLEAEADRVSVQVMRSPRRVALGAVSDLESRRPEFVSSPTQLKGGRREHEKSSNRYKKVLKIVMPGSGAIHWVTHTTPEKKGSQLPDEKTKAVSWKEDGSGDQLIIAGPQGGYPTGSLDRGENCIEKNVDFGLNYFKKRFEEAKCEENDKVLLLIKAHSRNAVAAGRLANLIKGEYRDKVEIDLVLFDPVPGPMQPEKNTVNDISAIDQSTLIYSVASGYNLASAFNPQKVTGAKRIILTSQDHQGGIVAGFKFKGNIYRGNRLNSLPEGVYLDRNKQDKAEVELDTLRLTDDIGVIWEKLYAASKSWAGDSDRHRIIREVIEKWRLDVLEPVREQTQYLKNYFALSNDEFFERVEGMFCKIFDAERTGRSAMTNATRRLATIAGHLQQEQMGP